jgi:hypothetical protein
VNEVRERMGGRFRPGPSKPCEAGKHRLSLGKVNVGHLAAVAAVPTEGRPLEAGWFRVEQEQDHL